MTDRRVLIVAAFASEIARAPSGVEVVLTGLGKTAAASVVTERLLTGGDRDRIEVWNVGTAGALRDGLVGMCTPGRVINSDINAEAVRALGVDPGDDLRTDGFDDGTVLASGDVFVADPELRATLARRADLVDMEAFGVVHACRRLDVPVRLVKHISDSADEAAMEWNDVVDRSASEIGAWLLENLPG